MGTPKEPIPFCFSILNEVTDLHITYILLVLEKMFKMYTVLALNCNWGPASYPSCVSFEHLWIPYPYKGWFLVKIQPCIFQKRWKCKQFTDNAQRMETDSNSSPWAFGWGELKIQFIISGPPPPFNIKYFNIHCTSIPKYHVLFSSHEF